jgi:hypothetical protein
MQDTVYVNYKNDTATPVVKSFKLVVKSFKMDT